MEMAKTFRKLKSADEDEDSDGEQATDKGSDLYTLLSELPISRKSDGSILKKSIWPGLLTYFDCLVYACVASPDNPVVSEDLRIMMEDVRQEHGSTAARAEWKKYLQEISDV